MHLRIVDLPEPALADEAEALARADREAHVVEDLPRLVAEAEGDRQAVDRDVAHAFTSAIGRFQLSSRRSTGSGARLPPMCGCAAIRPRV